ncbi:MAG: 50S ribosomal protein L2 [Patescibacteria group bacterium]|nr:MAG: 50S ribosomal protein L2 [Patescibacteria group bacterium]
MAKKSNIDTKLYAKTSEPERSLIKILPKKSGRNNEGKITTRHKGARQKRYYRLIDWKRDKFDVVGTIKTIEYDPNRNAQISLVEYEDGEKRYILHIDGLNIGDKILSGEEIEFKPGNATYLKNIPLGMEVSCVELYPKQGAQIIRSAGSYAVVLAKEGRYVHLKMPSREVRRVFADCMAVIGRISNAGHRFENISKAGRNRLKGIRPTVRGVAQNPHDHPHGGGEGKTGEGRKPKTPWGKPARGVKTRKPNKYSDKFIVNKRK